MTKQLPEPFPDGEDLCDVCGRWATVYMVTPGASKGIPICEFHWGMMMVSGRCPPEFHASYRDHSEDLEQKQIDGMPPRKLGGPDGHDPEMN